MPVAPTAADARRRRMLNDLRPEVDHNRTAAMEGDPHPRDTGSAEELLRRALLDSSSAAAVALPVRGLPLSQTVTVIFHGRRDLATLQTYVTRGGHGAGSAVGMSELLRVPCDLDLADADDREEAERLYAEQAIALRDALVGADTVLDIWRAALTDATEGDLIVDRSIELEVSLPAHRLLPVALVAPDRHLVVTPVCSATPLSAGRPRLGIACAQQDVVRVYPLPDDPERCLDDFFDHACARARELGERLRQQEASVERFLEINLDDDHLTG